MDRLHAQLDAARGRRAGFTINEILVATALMSIVMLGLFTMMQRDVQLQRSSVSIAVAERRAQSMLYELERDLANARAELPEMALTMTLGSAGGTATVTDTLGFPDQGLLLFNPGNGNRELVTYTGLNGTSFFGLDRGQQCTDATTHVAGATVLWGGAAEVVAAPADGTTNEPGGPAFFRGTGIGFSYRVPTDAAGGTDFIDGTELTWGSDVMGAAGLTPSLGGWGVIRFQPVWIYDESTTGDDINGDGDTTDQFDVGQLRRHTWDTANPAGTAADVGLGPTVLMQERCNWGGDLDNDGFDDPMFLWDEGRHTLHVRLFILGSSVADLPIVRRVESIVFLRNHPQT